MVDRRQRYNKINQSQNQSINKNIESSITKKQIEVKTAQPVSTFVSRRELNLNTLVDAKGMSQLPVRDKNSDSGRRENINEKKVYKYEYKSIKNSTQSSRSNINDMNPVEKNGKKSYKFETTEIYDKRKEKGTRSNFNMRKSYTSQNDIDKIIALQRWWRYLLKNDIKFSKFSQNETSEKGINGLDLIQPKDIVNFRVGTIEKTRHFDTNLDSKYVETKKIEIFQSKRSKIREYEETSEDIKNSGKYGVDIRTNLKFSARDGITKEFIKEKMKEIWMDENRQVSENKFSLINKSQNKSFASKGYSPEKKGMSFDNIDDINHLLDIIKQKDTELNIFVTQLKSQITSKHKTY